MCHISINSVVMCQVSRVTWYVSHITCCGSHIACHRLHVNAANIHSHVPEFIKVTIMQMHDCTKCLRICAKFVTNEQETGNACPESFVTVWQSLMFLWHFLCISPRKKKIIQTILIAPKKWLLDSLTGYCTHLSGHWTPNCEQLTIDTR